MSPIFDIPTGKGLKPTTAKAVNVKEPWTPVDETLVVWLDAADYSTITETSGSVSQRDDKSGNDNHVRLVGGKTEAQLQSNH